jgi:hypothetical protein
MYLKLQTVETILSIKLEYIQDLDMPHLSRDANFTREKFLNYVSEAFKRKK